MTSRNKVLKPLAGSTWGADRETLLISYKAVCRSVVRLCSSSGFNECERDAVTTVDHPSRGDVEHMCLDVIDEAIQWPSNGFRFNVLREILKIKELVKQVSVTFPLTQSIKLLILAEWTLAVLGEHPRSVTSEEKELPRHTWVLAQLWYRFLDPTKIRLMQINSSGTNYIVSDSHISLSISNNKRSHLMAVLGVRTMKECWHLIKL